MLERPKDIPRAIEAVTKVVLADEPCFLLAEENRLSRSGKTMVRYQLLKIVRNDRLVTAYIYLGPAKKFHADQFHMLGGVVDENGRGVAVHTVAELQAGAEELRSRPPRRELEPMDLPGLWIDYVDERHRRGKHLTTSGYQGQLVRA